MCIRDSYLVFITSYLQYAVEGYEVKAFSYIPKNLLEEKLEATLLGIFGEMQEKNEKYYFVETNSRFERIEYKEIIYVYKNNKMCIRDRSGSAFFHKCHIRKNSPPDIRRPLDDKQ